LLLNGHLRATFARCITTAPSDEATKALFERPAPERVAAISPMAQVRRGAYTTPTYVIHSTGDEIVAIASAERFVAALREHGVHCGLLKLEGVRHIQDLELRPGMPLWREQVEPGYWFLFEAVKGDLT